jgi:hypothetical protein
VFLLILCNDYFCGFSKSRGLGIFFLSSAFHPGINPAHARTMFDGMSSPLTNKHLLSPLTGGI